MPLSDSILSSHDAFMDDCTSRHGIQNLVLNTRQLLCDCGNHQNIWWVHQKGFVREEAGLEYLCSGAVSGWISENLSGFSSDFGGVATEVDKVSFSLPTFLGSSSHSAAFLASASFSALSITVSSGCDKPFINQQRANVAMPILQSYLKSTNLMWGRIRLVDYEVFFSACSFGVV